MNLVACFLIFLALFESDGNCSSFRYDRIGVVQLVLPCIEKVWNSSILGNFCISSFRSGRLVLSSDDAHLATSTTSKFWLRGICLKFVCSNSPIIWFVSFKYFCILRYTPYFRMSPFGEVMTTPTLPIFCTDDPSVWTVHSVDVWTQRGSHHLVFAMA